MDIRKQPYFYYSQNSLNTFEQCPLKFKLKYLEGIRWKNDSESDRVYYEYLQTGVDFHLLCERYYRGIPTAIEADTEFSSEFGLWLQEVKRRVPLRDNTFYYPEYEINLVKDELRLKAKYDLIIIRPDRMVEIWDWKTEEKRLDYKHVEKRLQTMVYLFVLKEGFNRIFKKDIPAENIKMMFLQPKFKTDPIIVPYSEEKHINCGTLLRDLVKRINKLDVNADETQLRNWKHCKYCEFQMLCNGEEMQDASEEAEI